MYLTTKNDIVTQLFKNFLLGGLTIASVSYMATFLNPIIASIWWAYPISIIPVLYFMKQNGINNSHISRFMLGITVVSVLTVISCYLLSYFIKNSNDGLFKPIVKASLFWILSSALFYFLVKFFGKESYFV
jgi:Kef-type K+ transport system membrane component KefB